jgi:hypothetical protein
MSARRHGENSDEGKVSSGEFQPLPRNKSPAERFPRGPKNLKHYFNVDRRKLRIHIVRHSSPATCHYAVLYAFAAAFFTADCAAASRAIGTR